MNIRGKCCCFSYIAYLMTVDEMTFIDEIDCRNLFVGNNLREQILVFEFM